jgi:hypothetical protein
MTCCGAGAGLRAIKAYDELRTQRSAGLQRRQHTRCGCRLAVLRFFLQQVSCRNLVSYIFCFDSQIISRMYQWTANKNKGGGTSTKYMNRIRTRSPAEMLWLLHCTVCSGQLCFSWLGCCPKCRRFPCIALPVADAARRHIATSMLFAIPDFASPPNRLSSATTTRP